MKYKINRIKELVKEINEHSYRYYTLDAPVITDLEWDRLYDELVKLEKETGFVLANSPSVKIGYKVLEGMEKVKHEYKLASLEKCKSTEIDILKRFIRLSDVVMMLKLDGLTLDLIYENGELISGATRGDGKEGELVTNNAKTFVNIPKKIPYKGRVHITGEGIITYDTFNKIVSSYNPEDVKKPKHPRNLASGSLKQLDSSVCASRNMKFFGYIVKGIEFKTKIEQLEFIEQQGFDTVDYTLIKSTESMDKVQELIEKYKQEAERKLIPIDGMVFMYNDIEFGKSLGEASKYPKHSLAYKFEEEKELTSLSNVEWQMGAKNKFTPVGIFTPVEIDNTTVSRATLINLSEIERLDIGIGSKILVCKANQIIPKIISTVEKSGTIEIPDKCPICGSPTEIQISKSGIKTLSCTNSKCSLPSKIDRYASRDGMNIVGFSKASIELMISKGLINDIHDIYTLKNKREELLSLPKFGEKKVDKLLQAIESSKECELSRFLFALGIDEVGKSTAENMVEYAKDLETMRKLTRFQWMEMKDSGEVLSNKLYNFFCDPVAQEKVDRIVENLIFETKEEMVSNSDGVFNGKKIYLTGSFKIDSKSNLKKILQSLGASISSGYAKSLDYLIYADNLGVSGKVDKAKADGIALISENELKTILDGGVR